MQFFVLICCAFLCLAQAEVTLERQRRQSGALTDAMRQSNTGGFGPTYGQGSRVGVGFGGKVWESGRNSVGLGGAVRADVGGSPFVRAPEVGVGATYNRGPNSFGLGVGQAFGPRPSNQVGFSFSRQFKRSVDDSFPVELSRERRQLNNPALDAAVANSLTNKGVGTPQFSYNVAGAGNSARDFAAASSAGAGLKVWERGPQSVGLGLGASGNLARVDGKTYTGNPQLGAGLGYQNGAFSATLGAGRDMAGPARSNYFGLGLGYKFRRDVEDVEDGHHTQEVDDEDRPKDRVLFYFMALCHANLFS